MFALVWGLVIALGIGKQERRATASLLAISGSRYRGSEAKSPTEGNAQFKTNLR